MDDHTPSAPTPSPSAPSVRLVVVDQRTNRDPGPKANQRCSHYIPGARPTRRNINLLRLILRNINYLRVRRLHDHHLRAPVLLHRNRLVLIAIQRTRSIGLLPQRLYGRHHRLLIRLKSSPQRRIVINVRRHHVQHLRKGYQRHKSRIEPTLQSGILQRLPLQPRVLLHPVICIDDLLGISRCRANLRQQRIRIQSNWRHQLSQLVSRRNRLRMTHAARDPLARHQSGQDHHHNPAKAHRESPRNCHLKLCTTNANSSIIGVQAAQACQLYVTSKIVHLILLQQSEIT
jgi:hypothetical protein